MKDPWPERRPGTDTDAEAIAASWSDPERFGLIFDRHFDAIYRYVACRVGGGLADDLASDAFVVAFRRRGSYDVERGDALPWLYGIVTNLLRRHHRAEVRRLRAYVRSDVEVEEFDASTVIARVDAAARRRDIAAALAALKPRDRDVFLLYAGADQSYEDIAHALGIPIGTVRSRINRARRVVRERLNASGEYQSDDSSTAPYQKEILHERP